MCKNTYLTNRWRIRMFTCLVDENTPPPCVCRRWTQSSACRVFLFQFDASLPRRPFIARTCIAWSCRHLDKLIKSLLIVFSKCVCCPFCGSVVQSPQEHHFPSFFIGFTAVVAPNSLPLMRHAFALSKPDTIMCFFVSFAWHVFYVSFWTYLFIRSFEIKTDQTPKLR